MARLELNVPWDAEASLVGIRPFPVRGTLAACIHAWRSASPKARNEAIVATTVAISAMPGQPPGFVFKGDAIAQLSARMPIDGAPPGPLR